MFKRKERRAKSRGKRGAQALTSVGHHLTFRAEVMPGKEAIKRTFIVERVLPNGRVELIGLSGEHAITEFERVP